MRQASSQPSFRAQDASSLGSPEPVTPGPPGQASVELAGGLAALLLVALAGFQLLAVGYGAVMADHAAESAALALVNGNDPDQAARAAVPGWPNNALRVRSALDRVEVTLLPPSALSFLRGRLAVTAEAAVRQYPRGGSGARRSRWAGG